MEFGGETVQPVAQDLLRLEHGSQIPSLSICICFEDNESPYTSHPREDQKLEQKKLEAGFYPQDQSDLTWSLEAKVLSTTNMPRRSKWEAM